MRLYHMPGSRSTRVLWMLEEIGVPYEITLMTGDERKTAKHINRHPLGRVPVLEPPVFLRRPRTSIRAVTIAGSTPPRTIRE